MMKVTLYFDAMLAHLKENASGEGDTRLIALFEQHREGVAHHFETCIPALDGSDWFKYKPTPEYPLEQLHGPLFHKGFRQYDVTASGEVDMAIWHALSGFTREGTPQSSNFWNAHKHAMDLRMAAEKKA